MTPVPPDNAIKAMILLTAIAAGLVLLAQALAEVLR